MRLVDYLDQGVFLNAKGTCFITNGEELSYQEVQNLSYQIANGLQDAGFGKNSKVAILSPNHPASFTCILGLSRIGAVWVPINPRNGLEENHYILDNFDCEVLFYHSNYEEIVTTLSPRLPKIKLLVCIDKPGENCPSFDQWSSNYTTSPVDVAADGNALCVLAGTGGTTGKPKGVMLSQQNVETFVSIALMCTHFEEKPVNLAFAPLTHAAGVLVFPILALGGTTVIMSSPDLTAFLSNIETYKVSTTFLPPTVIYMLLDHPNASKTDFSSLKHFWYGAAPMSRHKLKLAIELFGPVMTQFFGQTEAPMLLTYLSPEEHFTKEGDYAEERLLSCGRPTPLVKIAIMDNDGNLLPRGERGEVVIRSSLVMLGYYKNKTATESAMEYDWLHTGDIGYFDEEGYLYIVDRKKDMIITGGFNVFSGEVENAILQHKAVQDCAVIGIPHEKWGEMVVGVIQLREGQELDEKELITFCKERIGSVKSPKKIIVMENLPRSTVGKVLKRDIRKNLIGKAEAFLKD